MDSNIVLDDRVYVVKYLITGRVRYIGSIADKKGRFFGIESDSIDEKFSNGS